MLVDSAAYRYADLAACRLYASTTALPAVVPDLMDWRVRAPAVTCLRFCYTCRRFILRLTVLLVAAAATAVQDASSTSATTTTWFMRCPIPGFKLDRLPAMVERMLTGLPVVCVVALWLNVHGITA